MKKILSSNTLKCIAMFCMLLDHLWAMVIPGAQWLTYVGRIAFPIFAFQLVEGYFHTSDLKNYKKRLFIFALISEIPYNLMTMSYAVNPFQQNVLWTFLIGVYLMEAIDGIRNKEKPVKNVFIAALMLLLGRIGGVDYGFLGVEIVLTFYFFRRNMAAQAVLMFLFCVVLFKGQYIPIAGYEFQTQGFALLALPFIWLYDEAKGAGSGIIRKTGYWFYPVHIVLLYAIARFI